MRPVKMGERLHKGGESSVRWMVLDNATDDDIQRAINDHHFHAYHGGPGSPFANKPVIRRHQKFWRILVTQSGGYDV